MSKYQILRILLIALCIGLASATMAEPSQSEIKDILVQALELQEHGTYQADLSLAGSTITIQQKQLSDGTVGRRATLKRSVSLENKHGSFDIFDKTKTAIKDSTRKKTPYPNFFEYATFELSEKEFSGNQCYQITVKITNSPEFIKSLEIFLKEKNENKEVNDIFNNYFPASKIYLIGVKNFFIYNVSTSL